MALLIDSSVLISLERAGQAPSALLERFGDKPVSVSVITASELLHGVHRADGALRKARREQFVESVLSSLPVLPVTLEVARLHSRLWAGLEQRGELIGTHDLLIAATALTHDLVVVTGNHRHFGKVEGLKVTIW